MIEGNGQNGINNEFRPADQASRGGNGGIVPPAEHRFKPGESGNPAGRPPAGASVKEWINVLAAQDLTEDDLRRIARDPKTIWAKKTAAARMLRTTECPDMADFAGLLRGENSLEDLRKTGIDTALVKRFRQRSRKVRAGDGVVEEIIDRDIELYDRAGEEFDRVCNRTDGRPSQSMSLEIDAHVLTEGEMAVTLSDVQAVLAALRGVREEQSEITNGST